MPQSFLYVSMRTLTFSAVRCRTASSERWIARQRSDPFVRLSRIESFRCRSAFKLLQLQKKVPAGLLHPGDIVIDCGAAPGSWSQVASSLVATAHAPCGSLRPGLVVAFDLLDFAPIPGVVIYPRVDLRDHLTCTLLCEKAIREHFLKSPANDDCVPKADIILSDMAPNMTGLKEMDVPNMMVLAHSALKLALHVSKPGASFVVKLYQSPEADDFKALVSRFYCGPWTADSTHETSSNDRAPKVKGSSSSAAVRFIKPGASRVESAEMYLVARGFRLPLQHT